MAESREYTIAPEVLDQARELGMYGTVEVRLKKMARLAVPATHPKGNFRYEQVVLKIDQNRVVSIHKAAPGT